MPSSDEPGKQLVTPLGAQLHGLLTTPWRAEGCKKGELPPVPPLDLRGASGLLTRASLSSRASAQTDETLLRGAGSSLLGSVEGSVRQPLTDADVAAAAAAATLDQAALDTLSAERPELQRVPAWLQSASRRPPEPDQAALMPPPPPAVARRAMKSLPEEPSGAAGGVALEPSHAVAGRRRSEAAGLPQPLATASGRGLTRLDVPAFVVGIPVGPPPNAMAEHAAIAAAGVLPAVPPPRPPLPQQQQQPPRLPSHSAEAAAGSQTLSSHGRPLTASGLLAMGIPGVVIGLDGQWLR